MIYKTFIVATFVRKSQLTEKLSKISEDFNIEKNKFYLFQDESSDDFIITYKIPVEVDNNFDIKKIKDSVILHKKNDSFYTINALNLLIERDFKLTGGNIDYKKYTIDWGKYKNCFILSNNSKLNIIKVKQIFN